MKDSSMPYKIKQAPVKLSADSPSTTLTTKRGFSATRSSLSSRMRGSRPSTGPGSGTERRGITRSCSPSHPGTGLMTPPCSCLPPPALSSETSSRTLSTTKHLSWGLACKWFRLADIKFVTPWSTWIWLSSIPSAWLASWVWMELHTPGLEL